jgi:hypothetical protein
MLVVLRSLLATHELSPEVQKPEVQKPEKEEDGK